MRTAIIFVAALTLMTAGVTAGITATAEASSGTVAEGTITAWEESTYQFHFDDHVGVTTGLVAWWSAGGADRAWFYGYTIDTEVAYGDIAPGVDICEIRDASVYDYQSWSEGLFYDPDHPVYNSRFVMFHNTTTGFYGAFRINDIYSDDWLDATWYVQTDGTADFGPCVENYPPETADDAYSTPEDTTLSMPAPGVLANDVDPDLDLLTAALDTGPSHGTVAFNSDGSFDYTPDDDFFGTDSFTYVADDGTATSAAATVEISVVSVNDPPWVGIAQPFEGDLFAVDTDVTVVADVFDLETEPGALTCDFDFGDGYLETGVLASADGVCEAVHQYNEAGIYDVAVTVSDSDGGSATDAVMVVVYDPSAGFVTGGGWIDSPPGAYYPSDLPFFEGSYYDWFFPEEPVGIFEANQLAAGLTYGTCSSAHLTTITSQEEFDAVLPLLEEWGFLPLGGYQDEGVVPADAGWQWITGEPFEFAPWLPGEPNDCGLGWEGCPPASEQRLVMDVDGWNDVPTQDTTYYSVEYEGCEAGVAGKATFGFVSKYKKGASTPTGNTEFQFHAADLNFHSTSYDWLVVTGSDYAKFKGIGTINGEGAYRFMIWAGDGDPDTFRMKIWTEDSGIETIVYDNGMAQPLGGGNIIVHKK